MREAPIPPVAQRSNDGGGCSARKHIAILATDGLEQVERLDPGRALDEAGATPPVVSPSRSTVRGWNRKQRGNRVPVDVALAEGRAEDFEARLFPRGVMNPDRLRAIPEAVAFYQPRRPV